VIGCRYEAQPLSGKQECGPSGDKRCPDGYACAADNRCWKNGEKPPADGGDHSGDVAPPDAVIPQAGSDGGDLRAGAADMATLPPDAASPRDARVEPDLPPPVPAPSSRALAAGATNSQSATYRAVRTVGQAPGGNTARTSATYRAVGGLVGATQR